jgi:NAD(P)H dehydrogenase (quinone)
MMSKVYIAVIYHSGINEDFKYTEIKHNNGTCFTINKKMLIDFESIEDHWNSLDCHEALIFGSPADLASVSGPYRVYIDSTSGNVYVKGSWINELADGFKFSEIITNSKLKTIQQLSVFASHHKLNLINFGLPIGSFRKNSLRNSYYLGACVAFASKFKQVGQSSWMLFS